MALAIRYHCPVCATPLAQSQFFHCPSCVRDFLVHDDIPILRVRNLDRTAAAQSLRGYLDTVRAQGWDAGVRRMLADVREDARGAELRTLLDDSRAGWMFLLAKPSGAVALDFGSGLGAVSASLARTHAHVVACDGTLERLQLLRERARNDGLSNLSYLCAGDSPLLPFPNEYFDLVVLNDGSPSLVQSSGLDPSKTQDVFLREVHRVLKQDGQLYLATERTPGPRSPARLTASRAHRRMLSRAGFPATRAYSLLPSVRHIDQIVDLSDASQMRAALPLYRGQSRLRQSLLRGRLHKYVAPSVGIVASKQRRPSRFVDRLVQHVYASQAPPSAGTPATVGHYRLSQKGMLILQVEGNPLDVIIRVPLSPVARRHAECNAAATGRIHDDGALPADVTRRVPRPVQQGVYDGIEYFAETRIPGCEASALESATLRDRVLRAAIDFAVALHGIVRGHVVDAASYEVLVEENLQAVERLVPDEGYESVFARLRMYLSSSLIGLPLVRQMGDFALSNLIVDPRDGRLDGVIDWDRARAQGLPLLDVAHLFASSSWASMCAGEVMTRMLLPQQFDAARQQIWDSYRERMALPPASLKPLCWAWWLDFIHGRMDTSAPLDDAWVTRNVRNVLADARSTF